MRVFRARGSERLLRDALKRAAAHTNHTAGLPTDVQLLGQVSGRDDWPQIRAYWTRRAGMTGSWPTRLGPDEVVLNLWPIPPGHLQLTTGVGGKPPKRQPRQLLATPALLSFDATASGTNADEALARATATWLEDAVIEHSEFPDGVRLAPPILEEWAPQGRLLRRSVLTFDIDWPIAAADGLTWPPLG